MTCPLSADAPGFNSTSEINVSSLAIRRSTKGRPESSSRSSGASRNPSVFSYHSRDALRFRTSIAQLSAMENGGLPHIPIVLSRILSGGASPDKSFSENGIPDAVAPDCQQGDYVTGDIGIGLPLCVEMAPEAV